MNQEMFLYLQLGFEHIADLNGYDHILFITALCALYEFRHWKTVVWLVTAFTIGHTITLALSTLHIITVPTAIVEFCIPLTIVVTSITNIMLVRHRETIEHKQGNREEWLRYGMAILFGFIHGMGFSTYLKSLLGRDSSIILQLLGFNVGLECGQIVIVLVVLGFTWLLTRKSMLRHRDWALVLSGITGGVALTLMIKNYPW